MVLMEQGIRLQQNYMHLHEKADTYDKGSLVTPPTKKERIRRSTEELEEEDSEDDFETTRATKDETPTPRTERATTMLTQLNIEQRADSGKKDCSAWRTSPGGPQMAIRERAPEPKDSGRENRLKPDPNDDNRRIAWTEHRAGDGKSILIPQ